MTASSVQPRPHQVQALSDLVAAFAMHDRVQLVMACGTGKTFVGRWHAEASEARTVLVLVPSLALLAQTLTEWRRLRTWPFEALVVCSDPSTDAGAAERECLEGEDQLPDWSTVRARATTDPRVASQFLSRGSEGHPRVVFSTYHSAPVVVAAQSSSGAVFDLAICDEAHRLAGNPREEFRTALNPRQIVARRRLFMTATPRVSSEAGGYSMDDPTVFGPVAHTVTFGDAIRAGLLCDYQVTVLGMPGGDVLDDPLTGTPAALLDAIDRHSVTRVLSFHARVAKAAAFAAAIDGVTTPSGRVVYARHLSGKMPTSQRTAGLAWLGEPASSHVRVISNARVLTEGVDVPAVDAVCFADSRSSVIDIIQAVGRVLRPHPGKTIGTIIVPIGLPTGGDDDTELLVSRFALLWSVLRALRSHDQRFAFELDQAVLGAVRHGRFGYRSERLEYVLPDWLSEDLLHLRVVQEVGDAWERFHATTQAWAFENVGRRLPRLTRRDGLGIGEWAVKQRAAHAAGMLPADRARRLEEIPDWYWDRLDAAWADTYSILRAFADANGSVEENPCGASIFEGLRAAKPQREQLGVWLAMQRQAYRAGTLDPERAQLLEQLPGWTWTPIPVEDLRMVDALAQFVEFEKHAVVPDGHLEDGLELGRWTWTVRRRKLTDTLHPALENEIWAATPSRWRVGARTRWQWEKPETQWRLAYTALRSYARREGHAAPPTTHREHLPDGTVKVGQWVALQRHQHRKEELPEHRARALDALPGWRWDGDVGGTRPFEAPLELPAHLEHGSAGAIARRCHCEPCALAARVYSRSHKQRQRAVVNGVPAAKARRHLERIEPALIDTLARGDATRRRPGIGRSLIASTAGVPLAVVRGVLAGTASTITRDHEARLLAMTTGLCLSNVRATGSRGRLTQAGSRHVPAEPTLARIAALELQGFNRGWIGRELGYTHGIQLAGPNCTEAMERKVAALHRRVGDLQAPALPPNRRIAALAELKAGSEQVA